MHGNTKHGHYVGRKCGSPTVQSWLSMMARCTDPKHLNYKNYGERGITFDSRWLEFSNFLSDMGERPEGHTLDRIDPNGNYCKDNCRWANAAAQQHTRRDAKLDWQKVHEIKHLYTEGFTQTALAEKFGVTQSTIHRVISGKRWGKEDSFKT